MVLLVLKSPKTKTQELRRGVLISDAPKFLAASTLDCVMLADARITDMINIPSPNGNSYSTATREIGLVFSPEMVAHSSVSHVFASFPKWKLLLV